MFRVHVLIIRRSKLHYTASGIITPLGVIIPEATCRYHGGGETNLRVPRLNSPTIATDSNNGWPVPDAVDTVICVPDDVEQFADKINCV